MVRQPHYKDHFSSGQVVVLIAEFYCTYINNGQAKNILYAGTGFFSVAYIDFTKLGYRYVYASRKFVIIPIIKPDHRIEKQVKPDHRIEKTVGNN